MHIRISKHQKRYGSRSAISDPCEEVLICSDQENRGFSGFSPTSIRLLDYNCKETTASSIKLRFDGSYRTSLAGLSALLLNEMSIFTLINNVGSILARRHRFRVHFG